MPIVTFTILIACVGFSMYAFSNRAIMEKYMFNAYAIKHFNQKYRFLSHAFIHANYGHLIMNMYALYLFGRALEIVYFPKEFHQMSTLFYILLFTGGIYASSLVDYIKYRDNPNYNAVGASGAVSALIFSSILISPLAEYYLIFIPFVAIPSWILGAVYLAYSFYMNGRGRDNIAHGAHAWGAVFGFIFTGVLKPSLFVSFVHKVTFYISHFNQ
jgi:membrane associated rhomboid family serine protease